MSDELRKAIQLEAIEEKKIDKDDRPLFHLTPRTGWMNDPNGFSLFEGKYHLFYQYYPYESKWGLMHWGHAVSEDLLNWEYLPAALAPDEKYDNCGCYSGSAIVNNEGKHLLMYTGVTKAENDNGAAVEIQAQCIAVFDGKGYEKYCGNPVISGDDLPKDFSISDFRDPKIIKRNNGGYYCVIGNLNNNASGQILLFESKDGYSWKYKNVLLENKNGLGTMWECPDLFFLDGEWVLLISPVEMKADGYEYHDGHGTVCITGSFDEIAGTFKEKSNHAIDYGTEFYAPQTVLANDGRRIMIGWLEDWDTVGQREPVEPWFGQMSIPRELLLKEGRLYQKPVKEIEKLYRDKTIYESVFISGEKSFENICGRTIDFQVSIKPANKNEIYDYFEIKFAKNNVDFVQILFDAKEDTIELRRHFSLVKRKMTESRKCKMDKSQGVLSLRIILDRYSAEVFINDGQYVMSSVVYSDVSADGISFFVKGEAIADITKYNL